MASLRFSARSLTSTLAAALAVATLLVAATGCAGETEEEPAASEAAFSAIPDVPSEFPSDSGWALAMIARACEIPSSELAGAVGTIRRGDDGVIYEARRGGAVVASAWARSTFIGAAKRCVSK